MRNPLSDKAVSIPWSGIRKFFDVVNEMPDAISLGVGGIMNAKRVVLLATGEGKAKAIRDSIKGNIDPKVPASILRAHQNVQFFLDEGAASLL